VPLRWPRLNEEIEMIKTSLTAVALAASLAACGTLPEPATPTPDLPERFAQAGATADRGTTLPDQTAGWGFYADPVL
jgi:hypothetical protein